MQELNKAHAQLPHLRKAAWIVMHLHLLLPFEQSCCFQRKMAMLTEMCPVRSPEWVGFVRSNS